MKSNKTELSFSDEVPETFDKEGFERLKFTEIERKEKLELADLARYRPYKIIRKTLLAIAISLALSGCSISNQEIIKEKNRCVTHGMDYEVVTGFTGGADDVICVKPI